MTEKQLAAALARARLDIAFMLHSEQLTAEKATAWADALRTIEHDHALLSLVAKQLRK